MGQTWFKFRFQDSEWKQTDKSESVIGVCFASLRRLRHMLITEVNLRRNSNISSNKHGFLESGDYSISQQHQRRGSAERAEGGQVRGLQHSRQQLREFSFCLQSKMKILISAL